MAAAAAGVVVVVARAAPARAAASNFLDGRQRRRARATVHRRLVWYHGADYRREGHTGKRMQECIAALPEHVIDQFRADAVGGFGPNATYWSLYDLVDRTPSIPGYGVTFRRGTITIRREGQTLATLVLETEEQWATAEATLNPTGKLNQAPEGALRILCVCTVGLGTGIALRLGAERHLRRLGISAWLQVVGVANEDAAEFGRYADVVLVTDDDVGKVTAWQQSAPWWAWHQPRVIVLSSDFDIDELLEALKPLAA